MDHGGEVNSSKPPLSPLQSSLSSSSSSTSRSSHGFSQTNPEETQATFSFDKALNDINERHRNYSIPGKALFASSNSTSEVSDESILQKWAPMQSPPVQVMENPADLNDSNTVSLSNLTSDPSTPDSSFSFEPWSECKKLDTSISSASKDSEHSATMENPAGGFDTHHGPPSSIFRSKSSTPTDWSTASNESLFSIQIGNHSFSGDIFFRSGELDTYGVEHVRYGHMCPLTSVGGDDNNGGPQKGVHNVVPLGPGANGHTSSSFVAHPVEKKPEPTRCQYCCAGWTCDHCHCLRKRHSTICSGCSCACLSCWRCFCKRLSWLCFPCKWLSRLSFSCKWLSRLSFSCHCLRCHCCKLPRCPRDCGCGWPFSGCHCCCGWPFSACHCCKLPKCHCCLSCHCCKQPKSCCCCNELPCLNCYCCESIKCSCLSLKCPIWRSCLCHGSRLLHL
ncbi:unnamed protein product [Cuscuta epithymum]|uniref:Uncharacterized protein n=1 Tax=Cuscuta epithymum TaxID=186058 RepID=A0AAV0CMX8_9ASTE|nr:unnamed protein product [Cuscuta epithymum]